MTAMAGAKKFRGAKAVAEDVKSLYPTARITGEPWREHGSWLVPTNWGIIAVGVKRKFYCYETRKIDGCWVEIRKGTFWADREGAEGSADD